MRIEMARMQARADAREAQMQAQMQAREAQMQAHMDEMANQIEALRKEKNERWSALLDDMQSRGQEAVTSSMYDKWSSVLRSKSLRASQQQRQPTSPI